MLSLIIEMRKLARRRIEQIQEMDNFKVIGLVKVTSEVDEETPWDGFKQTKGPLQSNTAGLHLPTIKQLTSHAHPARS